MVCWIFGRGCGGSQEARENEKLREYTSTANKLITRSAAVGAQFNNLRENVQEQSRDDVEQKMVQMVATAREIAKDSESVEVPEKALEYHPLLELVFNIRVSGLDKYRAAILDVLDEKNIEQAADTMSSGLLELVVSDATLQSYRGGMESELSKSKISFEKVADSVYMPNAEEAIGSVVLEYINELSGEETTGDELHGVAVVGLATSPARVDRTESGISILPYSDSFTVKVTVQNQGNQTEDDIPVAATLSAGDGGNDQKKTQKITRLKAGESATLVFEGLKPATGEDAGNLLNVKAGPVRNERNTDNNVMELEFIMSAETG